MRRTFTAAPVLLAIFLTSTGFFGIWGTVKKGNELFDKGDYGEAMSNYTQAQLTEPDNPILHYNVGSVLYKQKKYGDSIESFQKVIDTTNDPQLKEKALYNSGNAYFRQAESAGDVELLQKSVDAYTEALKIDPNDDDAKFNLEVARRKLELKKQEPPPQSCPNPKQQQQDKKQNQRQDKQQQEKNKQEDEQQQNKQEQQQATQEAQIQPQESPGATAEARPQPQQQPREFKGEMSKEDAERLLKALEDKERENAKEEKKMRGYGKRPFAGKDW